MDEAEVLGLASDLKQAAGEVRNRYQKTNDRVDGLQARFDDLEQKAARRGDDGVRYVRSAGREFVEGEAYKAFVAAGFKGTHKMELKAALTSSPTSAGSLVGTQRETEPVTLPRRQMTIRDLLMPGQTNSNLIEYTRQSGYTNAARIVSEGAEKPESAITYELENAPVRTIAHWIPVSRQVMDDAPQLSSLIDTDLRYGLDYVEETEVLFGDGTGVHLFGLVPQATAYVAAFTPDSPTIIDTLGLAIAQSQVAELPATGIVLNTLDWWRGLLTKDGEGRYILGPPMGIAAMQLWNLPVVASNAMPQDEFLVGAFGLAATLYDRQGTEVLVSDSDRDNFIKNMLTVRAEKRVALAVKRPEGLVHGDFGLVT